MQRYTLSLNNESLPILIRKHPRSRRMVIRYQPLQHSLCLTLPRYATIRQGLDFVESRRGWIERQLRERSPRVPFSDGVSLPVLGERYTITSIGGRGVLRTEGGKMLVPGDAAFLSRRVRDWIIAQARAEIDRLAREKSARIGVTVKRISLRDTLSRWGSCSKDGALSFSWRLAFAPADVLDYLVCHEVAHLRHHNHGAAFWKLVETLRPGYEAQERWLKTHGPTLYAYG